MSITSLISKDTVTYNKKVIFNAGIESIIDYGENKKNFSPKIQLLFSPFGLPFVPIEVLGTNTNEIITALNWTKDRNNPGGILQLQLTPDPATVQQIVDIINKASFNLYSGIWGELGVDLEDLFKPMTVCQLWIDGYHVMTGTVRSCIRTAGVSNTDKQVSYSLTIDELGNLYNLSTVSMDKVIIDGMEPQILDVFFAAFDAVATVKGVSLGTGIKAILKAFLTTTLGNNVSLSDGIPIALRLLAENNPLGAIGNVSFAEFITTDESMFQLNSTSNGQSSVWNFLKNLIPSPWMEFFTESGGRTMVTEAMGAPAVLFPGFNYVVARSVPYSNPIQGIVNPLHISSVGAFDLSAIQMLIGGDFVIITDDMIHEKSLGIDSVNQSTVFHSRYTDGGAVQASEQRDKPIQSLGPLNPFASGGISTFGIREMFQTIDCTNMQGLGSTNSYTSTIAKAMFGIPTEIISKPALSNLLATWFRNQSRMREGSVTVRGLPYARAGMYCLYLPSLSGKKSENLRDIGIYYIDSLTHSYALENDSLSFTTTLNLIRGVPIPSTLSQSALLLFDFEILPPDSGVADGEHLAKKIIRDIASQV